MHAATPARLREYVTPGLTLVVLVTADVLFGPRIVISGSFGLAAVIAALFSSLTTTATMGAAATALAALSGAWNDNFGTLQWGVRLLLCAVLSLLAVASAGLRSRRERSLTRMTAIAETAQRALLKPLPPRLGDVELAARYLSPSEDTLVGGDLYEAAETVYGVRVIVGDVKGKGIDAVQLAATVLNAFRQAAPTAPSAGCVAAELDDLVSRVTGDEDFVTSVIAEFHDDQSVTLVNCGHPRPLLVQANGHLTELDTGPPQPPLGLGPVGRASTLRLPEGARLLLYTDGLLETRSPDGVFFPLLAQADVLASPSFTDALDQLLARLRAHAAGRITDDVAVLMAGLRTWRP